MGDEVEYRLRHPAVVSLFFILVFLFLVIWSKCENNAMAVGCGCVCPFIITKAMFCLLELCLLSVFVTCQLCTSYGDSLHRG